MGCKHGCYYDHTEVGGSRRRLNGGEKTKVDKDTQDCDNKDIQHRPSTYEFNKTEHFCLLLKKDCSFESDCQQDNQKAGDLEQRDKNTGREDDQTNSIGAISEKMKNAVYDG